MKLGIREENGSTFAYILVVMVVSFLLVAGLIQVTTGENNQSRYQTDYIKAYYIARAGAESMAMEMERMDNSYYEHFYDVEQIAVAEDMLDGIGEANVSVKRVDEDGFYRITSVGTYEDVSATVKIMMEYRERSELDFGVYAKEEMKDISIKDFDGDIGSGGDIVFKPEGDDKNVTGTINPHTANNITFKIPKTSDVYDSLECTGDFFDEGQTGISLVSKQTLSNKEKAIDDLIKNGSVLPDEVKPLGYYADNLIIDKSLIINEWDGGFDGTITIDTDHAQYYIQDGQDHEDTFDLVKSNPEAGEKWIVLYLEGEVDFETGATLDVIGQHNLIIIVEDGIEVSGTISVANSNKIRFYIMDDVDDNQQDLRIVNNNLIGIKDHPELLTFYLNPFITRPIVATIDNNPDFYGYIIGPEAIVNLKNGSSTVYGGIYANEVNIDASSSFYQLNPSNSNVTLYKQMGIAYWE
jgi:hypothetical protein